MRTVAEIIELAGGAKAITEAINATRPDEKPLTKDAVYKWPVVGIQDRHWPVLMKLTAVTAAELFEANIAARSAAAAQSGAAA